MNSRKNVRPRMKLKRQHSQDTLVETSHPEPSKAVFYLEIIKQGRQRDLKFHMN